MIIPISSHTGKNLHQCKSCEKCFTTRSKLKRHMLTHIHDGRSFVCYLCRLDFEQCHALKSHFNVKHSISKKDGKHCTLCEKVFLSQKSLEHHLKCVRISKSKISIFYFLLTDHTVLIFLISHFSIKG